MGKKEAATAGLPTGIAGGSAVGARVGGYRLGEAAWPGRHGRGVPGP